MNSHLIQPINDRFRQTFTGGQLMLTSGVSSLPQEQIAEVLQKVRSFDDFTPDNDPYGEHDFGSFEIQGTRYFWKIDYFDTSLKYRSEDPSIPAITRRVLTVMFANEY